MSLRPHRRKLQSLLIHSTVGKRAKRMPDTTIETTTSNECITGKKCGTSDYIKECYKGSISL